MLKGGAGRDTSRGLPVSGGVETGKATRPAGRDFAAEKASVQMGKFTEGPRRSSMGEIEPFPATANLQAVNLPLGDHLTGQAAPEIDRPLTDLNDE
jgi:hypothetical protein